MSNSGKGSAIIPPDILTDEQFLRDGYLIRELLSPAEIDRLKAIFFNYCPEAPAGFFATVHEQNNATRLAIHAQIKDIVSQRLKKLIPSHVIRTSNFVAKSQGANSSMPLHQDVTHADRTIHKLIHVWIPLVDVDTSNGCLKIVKGSHSFFEHRIVDTFRSPTPYDSLRDIIENEFMVHVPMKAGQAFFYDGLLMHASDDNLSDTPRLAINCNLLPAGVKPRIYKWDHSDNSRFWILEMSEEALVTWDWNFEIGLPGSKFDAYRDCPEGVRVLGTVDFSVEQLSLDQIEQLRP